MNNISLEELKNIKSKYFESAKKNSPLFSDIEEVLEFYKEDIKKNGYVDIEKIIKDCKNIELSFTKFENEDIDGNISFNNDKYYIKINENKAPARQRFTMAHEYSHYLFDKDMLKKDTHQDIIFYRTNDFKFKVPVDMKANYYAASLLMPETLFRNKHNKTNGDIYEMANFFKVSVLAIQVRYSQLGIFVNEW